jgi:diguanylate cyclase (GGDEF)-like protein/PAS domain S-box-containing protein
MIKTKQFFLPIVFLLIALTSLWCVVGWKSWQEREAKLAESKNDLRNLTHSLAQHASKSFGSAELTVFGVSQFLRISGEAPPKAGEIHDMLAEYVRQVPHVREIGVFDTEGKWIYSSLDVVPSANNSDREYFIFHKNNQSAAVRINNPIISRITGRTTLLLTKRLCNKDGSFAGVISAALDLAYFQSVYGSLDLGHNGSVTLLRNDGTVLVHGSDKDTRLSFAQSDLFTNRLEEAGSGIYSVTSPFDGPEEIIAYEAALDVPLVLTVARTQQEILAPWRQSRNRDILIAGVVSLVLLAVAGVVVSQMRRRLAIETRLKESEAGYRLLAENADDVVMRLGLDGIRHYVSPSIEKLTGWKPSELLGRSAFEHTHKNHRHLVAALAANLNREHPQATIEYRTLCKDGSAVWVETSVNLALDEDDKPREVVAIIRNVSKRKTAEEQLRLANESLKELSETDALTGLPNRRKFDEVFGSERRRALRSGLPLSVLFIDIDKFKAFNDTYGHSKGDQCLREVSQALASILRRSSDVIARYGGEEFAVILPDTSLGDAANIAENLRRSVETQGITHEGNSIGVVSVSVGAAGRVLAFPDDGQTLLISADAALYEAKSGGRNQVRVSDFERIDPRGNAASRHC